MNSGLRFQHARCALLVLLVALAAGCGRDESKKPATQVAAKVNSDEITVHQVNAVLAKTPGVAPEVAERAKREILDRLIDQQLAMQQAIHKKLDRSPSVQQALQSARNEILARAYIEQLAASQPKPSDEETKKYYAEHPALFAERRIFNLEEITLASNAELAGELRSRAAKARSLVEVAQWLQSKGVKFAPNRGVRAAEQIPLELLPQLQNAKQGEIVVIEGGATWQLIRVAGFKPAPVDEATASPRIQQFLSNRRASEAIAQDMKLLKAGANVQYLGEFAAGAEGEEAKAKAAAKAKLQAEAQAKAKEEAEVQARAEQATKARQAAETKARLEAEAKERASQSGPTALPQESIKKGLGAR